MPPIVIAAARMGYGHLRAGYALAQALGRPLVRVDEAPLAGPVEVGAWHLVRDAYEALSRIAAARGGTWARALDAITAIPADDADHRRPDGAARALGLLVAGGLGGGLVRALAAEDASLVATFFAPAHAADRAGRRAFLVVTDVDCARSWVPPDASAGSLAYCAPTPGVASRLRAYGVPEARVALTGFPLPPALARSATDDLGRRLERLRGGGPLRVLLAVGGAGAQTGLVEAALRSARDADLEVTVSVGTRPEVAAHVARAAAALEMPVRVVAGGTFEAYADAFDAALADTDVLWTKPSELVFSAALGVPIVAAPPVGVQEARNLAWLRAHDVVVEGIPAAELGPALLARREELARSAERGLATLPRDGAARISERVRS